MEVLVLQGEDFLREAKVMMSLDHQCIVQLLGISHGPPVLMVLELVPLGTCTLQGPVLYAVTVPIIRYSQDQRKKSVMSKIKTGRF
jgi:hypothetical protein